MGKWDQYLVTEPGADAAKRAAGTSTGPSKWAQFRSAADSKPATPAKLPGWTQTPDLRGHRAPDEPEAAPDDDALAPESKLGSAARGAVQGGTLRLGDELGAAAMMPVEAVGRTAEKLGLTQRPTPSIEGHVDEAAAQEAQDKERGGLGDAYRSLRDKLRADNETSEKTNPWSYGLGEAGAGLTLPVPGSAAMKGATLGEKVGIGMGQAAGFGAATGFGGSKKNLPGAMGDALSGGLMALPFGAAGGAMSHGAEKLAPYFAEKAGERAVQAAGARAGITDQLDKMGIPPEEVSALGKRFMSEGLIPTGLNPFRNPIKQTADRAAALKSSAGGKIGEAIDAADATGKRFDTASAQSAMIRKMGVRNPLEKANAAKANKLVKQVGGLGDSFGEANRMKSQAWEGADFRNDPKLAPKLYNRAAGGLRDDIQRQVGEAAGPDVKQSLMGANEKYGTASKAADLSANALSRDAAKMPFSPLKYAVSGAAGALMGGAGGGIPGASAGALISPFIVNAIAARGPNFAAHFNDVMSKASSSPAAAVALQKLAAELGVETKDLYGDQLRARFGGQK